MTTISDAAVDAAWAVLLRSSLFFGKDELRSALTAALSQMQIEKGEVGPKRNLTDEEVAIMDLALRDSSTYEYTIKPDRCLSCGMKMDYTEAVNDWKAKHGG